ncbi:MAG: substrate-binding domain-containing protein [Candidatus Hydrogenedentota bacterium]
MTIMPGAVPPPPSSGRSSSAAGQVVVLWTPVGQNVLRTVRKGIDEVLSARGYRVNHIHLLSDEPEKLAYDIQRYDAQIRSDASVTGVITVILDLPETEVENLYAAGKTVVFIERPSPCKHRGNVSFDHESGGRVAASALLELGRKKIAFIGPTKETGWAGGQRCTGCRETVEKAGLVLETEECFKYDNELAAEATGRLLDRVPDIDAIVYASDVQAFGGVRMLRERGIEIPQKIAIIGFDNSTAAQNMTPPLSSVRQPFEETGRRAAEMLLSVVAGQHGHLQDILLPEELIVRGSCIPGLTADIIYEPGRDLMRSIPNIM